MRARGGHDGIIPNVYGCAASDQNALFPEGQSSGRIKRWVPVQRGYDDVLHDDGLGQDFVVSPVPDNHEGSNASTHQNIGIARMKFHCPGSARVPDQCLENQPCGNTIPE